jgi:DNA-binding transcriptional LysR family regulator
MDKLLSMRVFVQVAHHNSFAKAADYLGISRAMATKHLISLENHLGTRLLNRTTRRLSLTEIGAAYRERCVQILAEIDEAEAIATQLQTEPRGTLRVTSPTSFGIFHLAPAVTDFMKRYPDVEVVLTLSDRILDLAEEGIDLAIRIGRALEPHLIARHIAHTRTVVCGAPTYLGQYGIPQTPQDLAHHNCLRYVYRDTDKWEFIGPDGQITIPVHGTLESNVGDSLRVAAIHGVGLVLQPTYMVGEDIKAGRLVEVLKGYRTPGVDIAAVYLHRRHLSVKVRAFVEFLQQRFQPRPYWDDSETITTDAEAR